MKKILLLASAWLVAGAGFAQKSTDARLYKPANEPSNADNNYVLLRTQTPPEVPSNRKGSGDHITTVTPIQIGSSANLFSVLLNGQNQVSYDQDLNTVTFVHRNYQGNGTNSGTLNFDISTNGGFSWSIDRGPFNPNYTANAPTIGACRYPSASIYNPVGNTDTTKAYIVANTPALNSAASGWGYIARHSVKLDGSTDVDENIVTTQADSIDFHPYALHFVKGVGHSISTIYNPDGTNDPARDTINYTEFKLTTAKFNSGTKKFDWTIDKTIKPNWIQFNNGGTMTNFIFGNYNIEFAPDGMTGYAVAIGVENDGLTTAPRPIVWKTTDGGATWNQETSYDFANNSVMQQYLLGPGQATTGQRPFFSESDITVDSSGALHIFAEVQSGYSTHPDSLGYTFVGYKYLMHCHNTGGSWNVHMVDSIRILDDYEIPSSGGNVAVTIRPQATRTPDGAKVFFSWVTTDLAIAGTSSNNRPWNNYPDVWACGYEVATGNRTALRNLSNNTSAQYTAFYATMSPVCKSNGSGPQYELPIVYASPDQNSALNPVDYYYLKGAGFDQSDFWAVSVKENKAASSDVSIYPNPSKGRFNISLPTAQKLNITVYDVLGNQVLNNTVIGNRTVIDLSSENAGAYFVKINSNGDTYSERIIVTK